MTDDQQPDVLAPALELLKRACREGLAAVEAAPSSREALQRAAAFFQAIRSIESKAGKIRNQKARRVWEEEELSLSHLARLMGVTTGRAGQLFPAASKGEGEP